MEVSDEVAYKIHGIINSYSDNDSDDTREFDEAYELLKPPPYDYELIKDKIILIPSQKRPKILNVWQTNTKTNNEIKEIEVVTKSNFTQEPNYRKNVKDQFCNWKTVTSKENRDACGPSSSFKTDKGSQKKFRKFNDYPRAAVVCEKGYAGINIKSREELKREFPSLDEAYKNNFSRGDKINKTEPGPSNDSTSNKKKKKHFEPSQIDTVSFFDNPKHEYIQKTKKSSSRRNRKNNTKTQCNDVPLTTNKINNKKMRKNKTKQSIKLSQIENLVEKANDINYIDVNFENEISLRNKTGTVKKSVKSFVQIEEDREKQSSTLLHEEMKNHKMPSIIECEANKVNLIDTQAESGQAENQTSNNFKVTNNLINYKVDDEHYSYEEFNDFLQSIVYDGTDITDLSSFTYEQLHLAYLAHIRKSDNYNKVENTIRNKSTRKKSVKKGKTSKPSATQIQRNYSSDNLINYKVDDEHYSYEEFNDFLQNIVYDGTNITDLSSFTYEQLHLAYLAHIRKSDNYNKVENTIRNESTRRKSVKKGKKSKPSAIQIQRNYSSDQFYYQNSTPCYENNYYGRVNYGNNSIDPALEFYDVNSFKNDLERGRRNTWYLRTHFTFEELYKGYLTYLQMVNSADTLSTRANYMRGLDHMVHLEMNRLTLERSNSVQFNRIKNHIKLICWEFGRKILKRILLDAVSQLF